MRNQKKVSKIIAVLLVLAMMVPADVSAAQPDTVSPLASLYVDSYTVGIAAAGNGKVEIKFNVMATGYMDTIGALSIIVYESSDNSVWKYSKTYSSDVYTSMIASGRVNYASSITHSGVAGKYYKAYITIWAGKDGAGDTFYASTTVKQAT